MTEGVAVLGVRHHGPGSARSVLRALERLEPDLVLVEGPPDAQALLPLAGDPAMPSLAAASAAAVPPKKVRRSYPAGFAWFIGDFTSAQNGLVAYLGTLAHGWFDPLFALSVRKSPAMVGASWVDAMIAT